MASNAAYYGAMGAGQALGATGMDAKHLATDVEIPVTRMCCGLIKSPPCGWYGPFGFLRIVAYFFILLFVYACLTFARHISSGYSSPVGFAVFLAVTSLFCAWCAWSHEVLMNQTLEVAMQNKGASKSLNKLEAQMDGLKGVKSELGRLCQQSHVELYHLEDLLGKFAYFSDIQHVCDLLRHFMSAAAAFDGNKDKVVDGNGLRKFLDHTHVSLRRVPDVERNEILEVYKKNPKTGINLGMVELLANALIANYAEPERAEALSRLFLFCLDPQNPDRIEACMEYGKLFKHVVDMPEGDLRAALHKIALQTGFDGPVRSQTLNPLRQIFCFAPIRHRSGSNPMLPISRSMASSPHVGDDTV